MCQHLRTNFQEPYLTLKYDFKQSRMLPNVISNRDR